MLDPLVVDRARDLARLIEERLDVTHAIVPAPPARSRVCSQFAMRCEAQSRYWVACQCIQDAGDGRWAARACRGSVRVFASWSGPADTRVSCQSDKVRKLLTRPDARR